RTGFAGATTGGSTRSSGSSYRRRVSSIKRPTLGACQPTRPPTKSEEIVEKAAGCLTHDKICPFIVLERTGKPIDAKTLRGGFRAELDRGVAVADSAAANAVYTTLSQSQTGGADTVGPGLP